MIDFQRHRPRANTGFGDSRLPRLTADLKQRLIAAQDDLAYESLILPDAEWGKLAHILVEFAEDLHNEIGLWAALEEYNRQLFGTPLPLVLPPDDQSDQPPSLYERLCHLLWVLYHEIEPDLVLSPTHQDLFHLAAVAARFLEDRFAKVPKQSGVKTFLSRRDRYGWDVKSKLIWLGQHSYLFRYQFANYVQAHEGRRDISTIDDFICQATTTWSGLGVIDILAATLPLNEAQRRDLRSWYERHVAYYRVEQARRSHLNLVNLLTGAPYRVRMDNNGRRFKLGQVAFGGLVPWDGEWYWSGEQRLFDAPSEESVQELRQSLVRTASKIVYRYDKDRLAQAQESQGRLRQVFLDTFGNDLVTFPDGLSMAAAMQKMYRQRNERLPDEIMAQVQAEHGLSSTRPEMPYPPELIENENGVGLFFNPVEGTEMMTGFNDVTGGFKKRGLDMTEDEAEAVRAFITSEAISPQFIQRLVDDYSAESVAAAFLIRNYQDQPYLDYLLHRHKGHFYRRRYPNLTLV